MRSRAARLAPLLLCIATAGMAAPQAAAAVPVTVAPPDVAALLASLGTLTQGVRGDGEHAAVAAAGGAAAADAVDTAAARLPACKYKDQLTRFREVRHWRKTLLDTNLKIRRSYVPWDLVPVSRAGLKGVGSVRRIIIEDLTAMAAAARRAGKPLAVRSAYRSYDTQVATFNSWVQRSGYQQALRFSARPGHSEHQLGTTVDFTTAPGVPLSGMFGQSPAGRWLRNNSWRYGFVMSYPRGQQRISCYGYEPWHFRYVGRELARKIHDSGDVPRRYLWEHFESVR